MTDPKAKTDALYVRVTPETKRGLADLAVKLKMPPSDVVRELVEGLIEGRVTVAPPAHVKEFYDVP